MTIEFLLYGLCLLMIATIMLVVMVAIFLAGQLKTAEIKPFTEARETVAEDAEKAEKAKNKAMRNKQIIDEAQKEMDDAVEAFISRGGLRK